MDNKIEMYCLTHKRVNFLEDLNYNLVNISSKPISSNYLNCDTEENIINKEKYYAELTFHYWYWKNKINTSEDNWIGFCQRRRFWTKIKILENKIEKNEMKKNLLTEIPNELSKFESFLCESVKVNKIKKMKIIKKGFRSLLRNPNILFDENKQTLSFQFNMQHGYNILEQSIELLGNEDKYDFFDFMNNSVSFNPHNMVIAKPKILNKWYKNLFTWLDKCESKLGFNQFKNYETRIYAFLSERYISYWFKKYSKCYELPWTFFEND